MASIPLPDGQRLHDRLGVGRLVAAGVELADVELAWLLASGRLPALRDAPGDLGSILAARPGLEAQYLVYTDLRNRGLPVRPQTGTSLLELRQRGASWADPPEHLVACHGERTSVAWTALRDAAGTATLAAVVDDDGEVTYYRVASEDPRGTVAPTQHSGARGTVLADRVLVDGPAAAWHAAEGIGASVDGHVLLSFVEAEHLRRRGVLDVPVATMLAAQRTQAAFPETMAVYEDLRRRGVVAKSGLKFGTHLRGYRGDPDAGHAEWLVHAVASQGTLQWSDVARGVRLAHGVRKAFLAAGPGADGQMQYVRLGWHRP